MLPLHQLVLLVAPYQLLATAGWTVKKNDARKTLETIITFN
jgi:hypothetical protein